jgi:hypothetical protein
MLCEGLGGNKDSAWVYICDRMGESKVGDSMELEWVELVNPWNAGNVGNALRSLCRHLILFNRITSTTSSCSSPGFSELAGWPLPNHVQQHIPSLPLTYAISCLLGTICLLGHTDCLLSLP